MHFMLQKEVVDRMAAARRAAGAYGRLTVMLAPWFEVEPLFDVGPARSAAAQGRVDGRAR